MKNIVLCKSKGIFSKDICLWTDKSHYWIDKSQRWHTEIGMDSKDRIYHLFNCRCCRTRHGSSGSLYCRRIYMRCRRGVLWCRRLYTWNCSSKNSKKCVYTNVQAVAANSQVLSKLLKIDTAFDGVVFLSVSTAVKWLPKLVQRPWTPW